MKKDININQKLLELRQNVDKETRLAWIVETCLEALKCGESFDVDAILQSNHDISGELKTLLELAGVLPLTYEITKVPAEVWEKAHQRILEEYEKLYPAKEPLKVPDVPCSYSSAGTFVADQRRKLKITQSEVANQLGVSKDEYSEFEGDRKPLADSILVELAQIIKVSVDNIKARLPRSYNSQQITYRPLAARKKSDKNNGKK